MSEAIVPPEKIDAQTFLHPGEGTAERGKDISQVWSASRDTPGPMLGVCLAPPNGVRGLVWLIFQGLRASRLPLANFLHPFGVFGPDQLWPSNPLFLAECSN